MNKLDLVNIILYLNPEAKFSVWETNDIKHYHGEDNPLVRFNMFVDWNKTNIKDCPSEDEIKNVDMNLVHENEEKKRKEIRNEYYKNDLGMKKGYMDYKQEKPDATFSDYLDYIESI